MALSSRWGKNKKRIEGLFRLIDDLVAHCAVSPVEEDASSSI
jgi:hypothetical protein